MKTLDMTVGRPNPESTAGEMAQRRIVFTLDGRSSGYLTVSGPAAMALAEIVSRGCRTLGVDFTMHRPPRERLGAVTRREGAHAD